MIEQQKLQIDPKHWQLVDSILAEYLSDCDIYAFGSRARLDAKTYSDLDLGLKGPGPISHQKLAVASLAFEESDLPWTVDLVDLNAISPAFNAAIANDLTLLRSASS